MGKILDRLLVVVCALFFLQMPLYMHVYQHQLSGRVAELQWQMNHMKTSAEQSGKTLDLYIDKFTKSPDSDFASQGSMMKTIQRRHTKFSKALDSLQHANWLTRPLFFFYYFDRDIGMKALKGFSPGIPCTWEGAFYALLGMACGQLLYRLLAGICKKSFEKKKT